MVRSKWRKSFMTTLAWVGLVVGQLPVSQAAAPTPVTGRVMVVQEHGKPAQRCLVLRSWTLPDGTEAFEVQGLETGEVMTIVEAGSAAPAVQSAPHKTMSTRIFHWGKSQAPPAGAPLAPPTVIVSGPEPPLAGDPSGQPVLVEGPCLGPCPVWTPLPSSSPGTRVARHTGGCPDCQFPFPMPCPTCAPGTPADSRSYAGAFDPAMKPMPNMPAPAAATQMAGASQGAELMTPGRPVHTDPNTGPWMAQAKPVGTPAPAVSTSVQPAWPAETAELAAQTGPSAAPTGKVKTPGHYTDPVIGTRPEAEPKQLAIQTPDPAFPPTPSAATTSAMPTMASPWPEPQRLSAAHPAEPVQTAAQPAVPSAPPARFRKPGPYSDPIINPRPDREPAQLADQTPAPVFSAPSPRTGTGPVPPAAPTFLPSTTQSGNPAVASGQAPAWSGAPTNGSSPPAPVPFRPAEPVAVAAKPTDPVLSSGWKPQAPAPATAQASPNFLPSSAGTTSPTLADILPVPGTGKPTAPTAPAGTAELAADPQTPGTFKPALPQSKPADGADDLLPSIPPPVPVQTQLAVNDPDGAAPTSLPKALSSPVAKPADTDSHRWLHKSSQGPDKKLAQNTPPAADTPKPDAKKAVAAAEPPKDVIHDFLPQASADAKDPLKTPESYGARSADAVTQANGIDTNGKVTQATATSRPGDGSGVKQATATTDTAAAAPAPARKSGGLMNGLRSMFSPLPINETPRQVAQAAPPRSANPTFARPDSAPGAFPDMHGRTLGAESVYAAENGAVGPVRYIPVPVVTLPNATKPPEPKFPAPPPPRLPHAPVLNPKEAWTNAFSTPPDAAANQPPKPPAVANGYPGGYGMYPGYAYGPMAPRMMPPYGPMGPAGAYGPPPTAGGMYAGGGMYPQPGMYPPGMPYPPMPPQYAANGMYPPSSAGYPAGMMPARPPYPYAPNPAVAMNPAGPAMGQGVITVGYQAPAGPANPAAYGYPGYPAPNPAMQLVATLQDSLYPSQREWAADNLVGCDWRNQPQVVSALTTSAAKDPAATVRAACVRALARMGANSAAVVTTVHGLKTDGDPRVRQAAEEALATLAPGLAADGR